MDRSRVLDVLVGFVMVGIGVAPTAIFLFGLGPNTRFVSNFGAIAAHPFFGVEVVQALVSLFGLFFAAMGLFVARYGRAETDGTQTRLH